MIEFEKVVSDNRPDLVLVYGDVNSTVAAALVCAKMGILVAHVEAGLRSFDRRMPEEINRLLTDQIADLLFTPSLDGNVNLAREGVSEGKIFFVGNVMIDSLVPILPQEINPLAAKEFREAGNGRFGLVTLHRPSNVDDPVLLKSILVTLDDISREIPIILPIHPRTRRRIQDFGIAVKNPNLQLIDPLGYMDFLSMESKATLVITDSGGIQEETTYLGIPCLTVRENTERPITVELGTNILVGQDMRRLRSEAAKILDGKVKKGRIPPLWDGKASERIADIIEQKFLLN
jgi:UDP-N-acetylglucosamine 2-epimerase (non-hydrolysing)